MCVCVCDSVPFLCSSVLALHELTEKADCTASGESSKGDRGERGKRWEGGGGGAGWEEEVRRRGGREANSSKRSVEYEEGD